MPIRQREHMSTMMFSQFIMSADSVTATISRVGDDGETITSQYTLTPLVCCESDTNRRTETNESDTDRRTETNEPQEIDVQKYDTDDTFSDVKMFMIAKGKQNEYCECVVTLIDGSIQKYLIVVSSDLSRRRSRHI